MSRDALDAGAGALLSCSNDDVRRSDSPQPTQAVKTITIAARASRPVIDRCRFSHARCSHCRLCQRWWYCRLRLVGAMRGIFRFCQRTDFGRVELITQRCVCVSPPRIVARRPQCPARLVTNGRHSRDEACHGPRRLATICCARTRLTLREEFSARSQQRRDSIARGKSPRTRTRGDP